MDSGIKKKSFVLVERTRSEAQRAQYQEIRDRGICPFCPEHISEFHKSPVLLGGLFWSISKADWLYKGVGLQLLIVSNRHAEKLSDLPRGSGEELLEMMKWAEKEFGIESGVFGFRFGDIRWNGASVDHLHCQIFVSNPKEANYKTPRLKMGPSEEELVHWRLNEKPLSK